MPPLALPLLLLSPEGGSSAETRESERVELGGCCALRSCGLTKGIAYWRSVIGVERFLRNSRFTSVVSVVLGVITHTFMNYSLW